MNNLPIILGIATLATLVVKKISENEIKENYTPLEVTNDQTLSNSDDTTEGDPSKYQDSDGRISDIAKLHTEHKKLLRENKPDVSSVTPYEFPSFTRYESGGSTSRADQVPNIAKDLNLPTSVSLLPQPVKNDTNYECPSENVLVNQQFLTPSQQFGPITVNSKNPNYDLRSAPLNPMFNVGPWLNTTIEPDLLRRPLECTAPQKGVYSCNN